MITMMMVMLMVMMVMMMVIFDVSAAIKLAAGERDNPPIVPSMMKIWWKL